jgi:hypothetical protein
MKAVIAILMGLGMFGSLAGTAFADQQLNVNVPGGGAADLLNMTTIPSEVSDSSGDPSLQRYCTNPSGRIVRQGQQGYEECLRLAQGKKPTTQPSNVGSDHGIVVHSQSLDQ